MLYITSASFEERCIALAKGLSAAQPTDSILLLDFQGYENVAPYLFNRSIIKETLRIKGYVVLSLEAEMLRPLDTIRKIERVIDSSGPENVVLDISTLPRSYLFLICRLLAKLGIDAIVRYYKTKHYGEQLSRGFRSVQSIPGFEGSVRSGAETVLILILGFEGYKAMQAWERVGPKRTIALIGDPPYESSFLTRSENSNSELFEQAGEITKGALDTLDVQLAMDHLQTIHDNCLKETTDVSIVLCPLGTKPQSLAAFAFAMRNQEVAVVQVTSQTYYTGDYSRGFRDDYLELSLKQLLTK